MAAAAAQIPELEQVARAARPLEAFQAPLRAFLLRHTDSIHDAEDLAQEVLLRLWQFTRRHQVRAPQALAFKIAINLLRDQSRRLHTRAMRDAVPISNVELEDCSNQPDDIAESIEALNRVAETIGRLPSSTQTAFLMCRIGLCSHAEIAARMLISVSMVEKHMSSATSALRSAGVCLPSNAVLRSSPPHAGSNLRLLPTVDRNA